ncbi:hypothetical protein [Zeaxanthinibacter enoshimensis]|uniref:hypothetical protein n=1 Tax=Zeaxanthinibacter enoshimensis TaxID=392009 RepID=UPI003563CF77
MKLKSLFLKIALAVIFLVYSEHTSAQVTEISVVDSTAAAEPKLKFGCGFGLSFVGGTNISLSPNLIFLLSEKVNLGAGLQGSYTSIKDLQKTTTIGGNVILQYYPAKRLMTLVELTQLNVSTTTEEITGDIKESYWDTAFFLGAGLNITDKIAVGAKFNLLYDEDESVYTSPVIPFVNITF